MKTQFETPNEYAEIARKIANENAVSGNIKPVHFKKVMRENRGFINLLSPYGATKDGLERKNPLIVALGDSVTAGHFEFHGDRQAFFAKLEKQGIGEEEIIEITDVRESYLEKFREMLIDRYEQTAVSVINSGIAGDTMYGMRNRLERDVIRYQPDLIILNGALNWGEECGDSNAYRDVLCEVVKQIKARTTADLILLTPNMELSESVANSQSTLRQRVEIIREIARKEQVCLVDVYEIWSRYQGQGYPIGALLANGENHPSKVGHELYAIALMKLLDS